VTIFPRGCRVLAVGDGDFVFSAALAAALQPLSPGSLVATGLDSEAEVRARYAAAGERLDRLREAGAEVLCGVDITRLGAKECPLTGRPAAFDRVVFNFPLLPAAANPRRPVDVHVANRAMLTEFLRGVPRLLLPGGLAVIASKDCHPYSWWRIESLPEWSGGEMRLAGVLPWGYTEYPKLYSGPCNVNRDASVKPTLATIFVFAQVGYAGEHGDGTKIGDLRTFVSHKSNGRMRTRGRFNCDVCGVYGLPSASELTEHESGKIHQKRAGLERRWEHFRATTGTAVACRPCPPPPPLRQAAATGVGGSAGGGRATPCASRGFAPLLGGCCHGAAAALGCAWRAVLRAVAAAAASPPGTRR